MQTDTKLLMRLRAILIATIITTCFILASFMGMAANPNSIKANRENLRMEISRNISCPDFITENSEMNDVKAIVNVDATGTVNIETINTANPQLRAYVTKQLQQMHLANNTATGPFVLVIKFRVL